MSLTFNYPFLNLLLKLPPISLNKINCDRKLKLGIPGTGWISYREYNEANLDTKKKIINLGKYSENVDRHHRKIKYSENKNEFVPIFHNRTLDQRFFFSYSEPKLFLNYRPCKNILEYNLTVSSNTMGWHRFPIEAELIRLFPKDENSKILWNWINALRILNNNYKVYDGKDTKFCLLLSDLNYFSNKKIGISRIWIRWEGFKPTITKWRNFNFSWAFKINNNDHKNIFKISNKRIYKIIKNKRTELEYIFLKKNNDKIIKKIDYTNYLKNIKKTKNIKVEFFEILENIFLKKFSYLNQNGLFSQTILYNFTYIHTQLIVMILLASILYFLSKILSKKIFNLDKKSAYECGFEPFLILTTSIEISFILVAFIFLIFDLELIFLSGFLISNGSIGSFGILLVLFYLGTVWVMIFLEVFTGVLSWPVWNIYKISKDGLKSFFNFGNFFIKNYSSFGSLTKNTIKKLNFINSKNINTWTLLKINKPTSYKESLVFKNGYKYDTNMVIKITIYKKFVNFKKKTKITIKKLSKTKKINKNIYKLFNKILNNKTDHLKNKQILKLIKNNYLVLINYNVLNKEKLDNEQNNKKINLYFKKNLKSYLFEGCYYDTLFFTIYLN